MIIGLTGHAGTGKDEVGKFLAQKYEAIVLDTSQPLRDILTDCNQAITRKSLQDLGASVSTHLGVNAIIDSLLRTAPPNRLIVINAVRYINELRHLMQRDDFRLLGIQSHFALRLERLRERNRDNEGEQLGVEALRQLDLQPTEKEIGFLITSANTLIINDNSIPELHDSIDLAFSELCGLRRARA
jgi:dephospho-CoA kinase